MPPDLDPSPLDHPPIVSDDDVRRYMAELLRELLTFTEGRSRLRTLRYLLDMARLEATEGVTASGSTPPR